MYREEPLVRISLDTKKINRRTRYDKSEYFVLRGKKVDIPTYTIETCIHEWNDTSNRTRLIKKPKIDYCVLSIKSGQTEVTDVQM